MIQLFMFQYIIVSVAPRDVTYNFFALCTDYENYLVAYGCVDVTPGDKSGKL